MEEEAQKMVALKKAYADIILNTAKEAAARIMVSERKALRFQQDLWATKDEAFRILLRLKQMFDSKTIEAEIKSSSQQKRIEELEAHIDEAEETIIDLRAELKKAHDQLDKVKNNHIRPLNGPIEKQDGPCQEGTKCEKLATSNPILSYPIESGPKVITSELRNTSSNQIIMGCKCCNSAKQSASLKLDLENSCADNPNFASLIMRTKESELYRNGCTQRVRAFERNLLDGSLHSARNVDDQNFLVKSKSTRSQIAEICALPPPNPTQLEDKVCTKSCTYRDQPFKFCKIQQRNSRHGKAKATSCSFNPNLVKPHQPSLVLSHCKTSSYIDNGTVKSGEGACTLPYGEILNKDIMESSGLEEKVQQNKDQALGVVLRSLRKRKVQYWDAIATSCRSLPDQLTNPCSVHSCNKTDSVNCIVESGEDQLNSESETKTETDVNPISGSTFATPEIKAVGASGFSGSPTDKETGLVDEGVLVKQNGDAAESMDSVLKDAEATSGTSSQADNYRLVEYTFSRKRRKESMTNPEENTCLAKNSANKGVAEKQNSALAPQKSSLIDESSRDSRRMAQVARQLISLSGKRW